MTTEEHEEILSSGAESPSHNDILSKEEHNSEASSTHNEIPELPKKPLSAYAAVSMLCLMVAFGGFVFGWDTGTIGGFVNMSDFKARFGERHSDGTYYMSNARTGLILAIFNVGCTFGAVFLPRLADLYGRRIAIMIVMIIYVIGVTIQIASVSKWFQYMIGRIISGLAVGAISVLSPMFISETSPKHLRGTLVSCFQLMITFGIFLGYCTNFGTKRYSNSVQWRVPVGLCYAWAMLLVIAMVLMPESPRYLVEVGRIDDAIKSVARVNKVPADDPAVSTEIQLIQAGIDREKLAGDASWKELITGKPKIFQRVVMGVMLQSLQQLTGSNYFFYYGTTIFQAVGLTDPFETSVIIGTVNFVSTFYALYTVEKYGRRNCLMVGAAAMAACFVVFASVGVTRLYPDGWGGRSSEGAGNCMIVFCCFFIFSFACTWAPCVYVVVSETYPLRIRSKGMAVATAANWFWNFLIAFFTPFITTDIHFYYGYVFMGCLIFAIFYVFFFVNETKGLALEEVDEMYAQNILPWKSSSWAPPSAEQMAHSALYAGDDTKAKTEQAV